MSTAVEPPPAPISEWKVVRGGLIVGAGLLAGQGLGFIRQATIAYLLGTGVQADAIAVAFAPIDLWWAVLLTGIIFGFGPMLMTDSGGTRPSFRDLSKLVLRVALVCTAVFLLFARSIVALLAPGLSAETADLATRLLRITALAIPALSWSTLFSALLYSERRFAFPAFHQGAVNLFTIAAALALEVHYGAAAFAGGYAAGAWLQLAGAYAVSRSLLRTRSSPPAQGAVWKLLAGPGPVFAYSVLIGLNPMVTRALASTFGPGATSAFDYCLRLLGVPLALLVTPLSSSLLTEIAPFRLRDDRRVAIGAIGRAAALTALAAAVMVLFMAALGPWVVAFLFERGRFGAHSTSTVTSILSGFFPVLIAWSVMDVISRSLFSLGRSRAPIVAAAVALLVNLAVSAVATFQSTQWIGLGTVLGFALGVIVVGWPFLPFAHRYGTGAAP